MHDNSDAGSAGDLTRRAVDEFFRRFVWYLVPIALFTMLGVSMATRPSTDFNSSGTVAVSRNPLVDAYDARGTDLLHWETVGDGTARLINEQLRTDAFISDIAERAGIDEALDDGFITTELVRNQISAGALGFNSVRISATWGDGPTAYLLAQSTIDAYVEHVAELVTTDSSDAIDFWTGRRNEARVAADAAERALAEHIDSLPPLRFGEEDYPLAERLELQRLDDSLNSALASVDEAQTRIDEAELNVRRLRSEAGRQITVIDAPEEPLEPDSSLIRRAMLAAMMVFVGLLVTLTVLIAATVLDRTIRSRSQLAAVVGTSATASVPRIRPSGVRRRDRRAAKKVAA